MTAKDYRTISAAIRRALDEVTPMDMGLPRVGVLAVANQLAIALSGNPRFDVARFLVACGVPDNQ